MSVILNKKYIVKLVKLKMKYIKNVNVKNEAHYAYSAVCCSRIDALQYFKLMFKPRPLCGRSMYFFYWKVIIVTK